MWDRHLVEKYSINGTSRRAYIHSVALTEQFDLDSLKQAIVELPEYQPISLFLHIPFCDSLCYCDNSPCILSKSSARADEYLDHLDYEIEQISRLVGQRPISDIYWGGDSPTVLTIAQIERLTHTLRQHFNLSAPTLKWTIDINPGTINTDTLTSLKNLGFNHLNINIEDLDPKVQQAINRNFDINHCQHIIQQAKLLEFSAINISLHYGLPLQTIKGFGLTLAKVISLQPRRLTIEHYQHEPNVHKHQRHININDLPTAADKLLMFENTIDQLNNNNFKYLGMGQFTRTNDELFIAQDQGTLHRNVQGYTVHKDQVAIGLGVSAMSQVNDCYSQNASGLFDYYEQLEQGQLAVNKGYQCSKDSRIRQAVIEQFLCQAEVKFADIESQFDIQFAQYFARELDSLKSFEYDGLISMTERTIKIHVIGRLLVRNICIVFDSGLSELASGNPLQPV